MAEPKPAIYAAGVTALGFICLALACLTAFLPAWGEYEDGYGGYQSERGYFGPFRVCKMLNYGREVCGNQNSFRISTGVYICGILALISCACFAIYCILSIIQIAMITSRDKVVMQYKPLIKVKFILAILAAILAIVAAVLFAVEIDNSNRHFNITRGMSFYLQIVLIVLSIVLATMSLYDITYATRPGGDPTASVTMTAQATTINNPGFREERSTRPSGAVSVTDSSGRPYVNNHGSLMSMNTTLTSVSNGSTMDGSITRSPLRSSLKKPRQKDSLGIQNPGYSGTNQSPTMQRSTSVKKVRIQTHSTDV